MNWELKLAIIKDGRPQYAIAQQMDWSESHLSRVINGRLEISSAERSRLAEILNVPERSIFGGNGDPAHTTGGAK